MLKELEYPFDSRTIISKKIKLRRMLLEDGSERIKKKICILGGGTTNDIKLCMELFLLNYGIEPEFYESEYNQYYQDSMFPPEKLISFRPDIIYICTTNRNITCFPTITEDETKVEGMLSEQYAQFCGCWENLEKNFHCPIIQNNFEKPAYRLLGNKDFTDIHGKVNYISRLNEKWGDYARCHDNFYICDIDYISSDYGLGKWHDMSGWCMYKYAMDLYAIPYLSFNVANIIKAIFGKNKKGYVLDLDNTLWGGIIGEDGVEKLKIGPEEAEGQAYLEFQQYLSEQAQLGILLNIASKNDEEKALAGLNHPNNLLHSKDMIVIKANWEPKDRNFTEIAAELNILPESLVFVDDNPAERSIVEGQLGVCAPDIGGVQDYIRVLDRSGFFEAAVISEDDFKRNQMYKENADRKSQQSKFKEYRDYLLSLEMRAEIKPFEMLYMARISQLTNKSNQFNLTTRRYTQEEIEAVATDKTYITLYGRLKDRFGDNGLVSVVIGKIDGECCHIELWLMSCRVLKRDMEFAMMDTLVHECTKKNIYKIIGYYYPTDKNNMVREFYGGMGFEKLSEDHVGNTVWALDITEYVEKNTVMEVN